MRTTVYLSTPGQTPFATHEGALGQVNNEGELYIVDADDTIIAEYGPEHWTQVVIDKDPA
jgi:hypothetical protein